MFRMSRSYKILGIIISIQLLLVFLYLLFLICSGYYCAISKNRFLLYTLKLDNRPEPSLEQLNELIRKELPSLPFKYLVANEFSFFEKSFHCAPYPTLVDIEFHNGYWQVVHNQKNIFYIFGAYYDHRSTVSKTPMIRLLTMTNKVDEKFPHMFCQLWFEGRSQPTIVPVINYTMMWNKGWGIISQFMYPTMVTCRMPEDDDQFQVPKTVSLVHEECAKATNNLLIYYELPPPAPAASDTRNELQTTASTSASASATASTASTASSSVPSEAKPRFAICVKALDYPYVDKSSRIIEWLELMRLLGAEKVTFYNAQVHPNITRVLRFYERTGFVDVRGLSMGRGEPHSMKHLQHFLMGRSMNNRYLNEIIPYNDCFYRNLYLYDFIGVFDIDEIIMPLGNLTHWSQLIRSAHESPTDNKCTKWASYCFRNIYFPENPNKSPRYPELPEHFFMLHHVERVAEHLDEKTAVKCFHSTKYVETLHNHFPISYTNSCYPKSVPIHLGQMQHYREPDLKETLNDLVMDDNIWRFSDQLISRVHAIHKEIYKVPESESY